MATFIDIGLLQYVKIVFPFILVWAVTYSILEWRKVLGESQNMHSIVAFVVAMLTIISGPAVQIIELMIPWFGLILIVSVFMIMFFKFFGVTDSAIGKLFMDSGDSRLLVYWVVLLTGLVLVAAIGQVFFAGSSVYVEGGPGVGESILTATGGSSDNFGVATGSGQANLLATVFHPKVLGMVFVLLLATFTIKLLAGDVILAKK